MSRIAIIALCLIIVSTVGVAALVASGGVSVVVQNKGLEIINNVKVHVTGNSYLIGSLAPGQAQKIRVTPKGESHVVIEFVDTSHNQHRIVAECYFEKRHYKGTITVDIAGNKVSRVDDKTELSLF